MTPPRHLMIISERTIDEHSRPTEIRKLTETCLCWIRRNGRAELLGLYVQTWWLQHRESAHGPGETGTCWSLAVPRERLCLIQQRTAAPAGCSSAFGELEGSVTV